MSNIIAIQGAPASFHDIAANEFFPNETSQVYCDTFAATFTALADGNADYALCAIENSLYGSINEVYDLLQSYDFHIIGEVYLRIEQCLIGLPDASLADITEIHSHPVALAQCDYYLNNILPAAERMEYHDTAASVEMVAKRKDISIAAIASRQAAELHGMKILASSIETDTQNYTRFVVLSKQASASTSANKTSMIIQTTHAPGALYHALGSFANRGINLSKLQSRPIIGKAWKYSFYVDVAIGSEDPLYVDALDELLDQGCKVSLLGSYVAGRTTHS